MNLVTPASIDILKGYLPKLGECTIQFKRGRVYNTAKATLNSTGRELGSETYSFVGSNTIHGNYIYATEPFKGKGVGEFLRAASIVEMMTYNGGKIKNFIIESMHPALGFHTKYGMKPYIKNYDIQKGMTTLMLDRRTIYIPQKRRAEELLKAGKTEELQNLINEYMQEVRTQMGSNLYPLKLTREDVLSNATFYNNLFERNGIDFRV